jgi:hypothetical protein
LEEGDKAVVGVVAIKEGGEGINGVVTVDVVRDTTLGTVLTTGGQLEGNRRIG